MTEANRLIRKAVWEDYSLYIRLLQNELQSNLRKQYNRYSVNFSKANLQSYDTQEDILQQQTQQHNQITTEEAKFQDVHYSIPLSSIQKLKSFHEVSFPDTNEYHLQRRSILQNTKLYNLRIRLQKYQKLNLEQNQNLYNLNQYFQYQGNKRSLINNKFRQKKQSIIKVSIDILIDYKKSRTCDIVKFLIEQMDNKSQSELNQAEEYLSQMSIKILYIFQKYFIKKSSNQQKRKKYRKCCYDLTSIKKSKYSQDNGFKIKSIQSQWLQKQINKQYRDYSSQKILIQQIWDQYLDLMPKDYSSMPYMPCNLQYFQGDNDVQSRCSSKINSIKDLFKNLRKMIDYKKLKNFYIKEYGKKRGQQFLRLFQCYFKIDNICWCYNVISTRTFSVHIQQHKYKTYKEMSFLSPYIDLLNHSEDPNCEWGYDEEEDCFCLMSSREIKVGQELTIRYGSISNLNLFINYGICTEQNQQESGIILELKIANIFNVQNEKDIFKKLFIIRCFYPEIEDYVQREQTQKQIAVQRTGILSVRLNTKNKQIYIKSAVKKLLLSFYCTYFTKSRGLRGERFDSTPNKEIICLVKNILKQMQIKIAEKRQVKLLKMQYTCEKEKQDQTSINFCTQFYVWLLKQQIEVCDQLDAHLEQEYLSDENGLLHFMNSIF